MSQFQKMMSNRNQRNINLPNQDFQVNDVSQIYSEKNSYNLEANFIKNEACNFPVEHHKSHVFTLGNVFFIENYDDVINFKDKVSKYLSKLTPIPTLNDDCSELNNKDEVKSKSLNGIIETSNIIDPFDNYNKGYLIFFVAKKIYCRAKVFFTSSDKAIKIQNPQEDQQAIEESLNLFVDSFNQILPEKRNDAYKDLITIWKSEDRCETMPVTPSEIFKNDVSKPPHKNQNRSKSAGNRSLKILDGKQSNYENANCSDIKIEPKNIENVCVKSNKEISVKSYEKNNFSNTFLDNRSLFGTDEELILFKISEFEVKLKDYQYEKYDKQIEQINEDIEKIKDTLEHTVCDETPAFHSLAQQSYMNLGSLQNSQFIVDSRILRGQNYFAKHKNLADSMMKGIENAEQYWDRVFTMGEHTNQEQFSVIPENLGELRSKLRSLRKQKDSLLKEREEAPGPIYSLMISQMNGFIKRNKRKLNILKDKYLGFFLKHFDKILTYRLKDSTVKDISDFERTWIKKTLKSYEPETNVDPLMTNANEEKLAEIPAEKIVSKKLKSVVFLDDYQVNIDYIPNNQNLLYRGTIINGQLSGFGVLTEKNSGIIRVEGHFVNDLLDGENIKIYNSNGKIYYEGCMSAGVFNGEGKKFHWCSEKLYYEGNFKNNEPDSDNAQIYNQNGELEYIGQMSEGKRIQGYGCLYHSNNVIKYKGDFTAGHPNGTSVEFFDRNGKLLYQGDVVLGNKHGDGKEYYSNGQLRYSGEWRKDNPHGANAVLYKNDGRIEYKGSMLEGKRHGNGHLNHPNGQLYYSGDFKDNHPYGSNIILYNLNGGILFKGNIYDNGFKEGWGKEYHNTTGRLKYRGRYKNDKPHGKGIKLYSQNGYLLYEGNMVEGQKEGYGKLYHWITGKLIYKGQFVKDNFHGKDVIIHNGHTKKVEYRGVMENGEKIDGYGCLYYLDGQVKYQGRFKLNKPHGKDCEFHGEKGELIYKGEYYDEIKTNGYGIEYHPNGKLKYYGKYLNGEWAGSDCKIYDQEANIIYIGEMINGMRNGIGKEFWPNKKLYYKGHYVNDLPDGKSLKLYNNMGQLIYRGDIALGKKSGLGQEYHPETSILKYKGEYLNDHPYGERVCIYDKEGEIEYEGVINEDGIQSEGFGVIKHSSGHVKYKGTIINGKPHSQTAILYNYNGIKEYEGELQEGQKEGKNCKEFAVVDNEIVCTWNGEYKMGTKIEQFVSIELF